MPGRRRPQHLLGQPGADLVTPGRGNDLKGGATGLEALADPSDMVGHPFGAVAGPVDIDDGP